MLSKNQLHSKLGLVNVKICYWKMASTSIISEPNSLFLHFNAYPLDHISGVRCWYKLAASGWPPAAFQGRADQNWTSADYHQVCSSIFATGVNERIKDGANWSEFHGWFSNYFLRQQSFLKYSCLNAWYLSFNYNMAGGRWCDALIKQKELNR